MKYKCRDCGKIYNEKPRYCECGNDLFMRIKSQEERDYDEVMVDFETHPREKTSIFTILVACVLTVAIGYFIRNMMNVNQRQPELSDEYLTSIRQTMMENFDPSGITHSGYCIISFQINDEGGIENRKFIKKSSADQLNKKVFKMLQATTIVEKPPKTYKGSQIKLEFGCTANETEANCYSKNILDSDDDKYK